MKRIVFIISIVILLGIGWAFTVSDFLSEKSKENYLSLIHISEPTRPY